MSRLLVDDVTKTDRRALLNVNKMATISDIVAPTREYLRASGADELTVESGCVIAVGGAGIFKTAETKLTAANLDTGAMFAVGNDYYVYICDSRVDAQDEQYVIQQQSALIVELVETLEQWEQAAGYDARELKERAARLWVNGGETETEYG